jgi:hypothetical protein
MLDKVIFVLGDNLSLVFIQQDPIPSNHRSIRVFFYPGFFHGSFLGYSPGRKVNLSLL